MQLASFVRNHKDGEERTFPMLETIVADCERCDGQWLSDNEKYKVKEAEDELIKLINTFASRNKFGGFVLTLLAEVNEQVLITYPGTPVEYSPALRQKLHQIMSKMIKDTPSLRSDISKVPVTISDNGSVSVNVTIKETDFDKCVNQIRNQIYYPLLSVIIKAYEQL